MWGKEAGIFQKKLKKPLKYLTQVSITRLKKRNFVHPTFTIVFH